jgi:endonuclease/exonuclease/phosphatase family metal-dependent hydrolase
MKIICLNTWGGVAGTENLLSFFNKYKDSVDIFCLQEIGYDPKGYENVKVPSGQYVKVMIYGLREIPKELPEHSSFFYPNYREDYGIMMLVKNNIKILEDGEIFVHKDKNCITSTKDGAGDHARNIQYVKVENRSKPVTIINFHGLWNGKGKTDSEDRLIQSDRIVNFLKTLKNNVVLCGDFNLLPETESIKKLEKFGLRNLITEYNIKSTRTSFYAKADKYADYCFVSKDIKVKDFKVLPDEVSDHAPLYIEIE